MRRWWPVLLLPGGAALAGLAWWWTRRGTKRGAVAEAVTPGLVHHRERAAGVRRELLAFLDWWAAHGPFPLTLPEDAGMRDDATQARLFAAGRSLARTARDTAHGRGAALDFAPVRDLDASGRVRRIWLADDLQGAAYYRRVGELAEGRGLVWGGRWTGFRDLPHLELPAWRGLPYPGGVA